MPVFDQAIPDRGASKQVVTRTKKLSFGDGYEQRVGDGINLTKVKWDLKFTVRPNATLLAIDTFLRAQAGRIAFDWAAPDGTYLKYKCEDWNLTYEFDTNGALSATFEQVFEP